MPLNEEEASLNFRGAERPLYSGFYDDECDDDNEVKMVQIRRKQLRKKTIQQVLIILITIILFLVFVIACIFGGELISWVVQTKASVQVNIHIKLSQQCEQLAIDMNAQLKKNDTNEAVDLDTAQQPHITLYLSIFNRKKLGSVKEAVSKLVNNFQSNCNVTLANDLDISGSYVMWEADDSACLQEMSNAIVNATYAYIEQDQEVPPWVYNISDAAIRQEKIEYVKKYGSPNVFDQFQPHVTLGGDDKTPDQLDAAARFLTVPACGFVVSTVALGTVGPFGTVMRGKDMAVYHIPATTTKTTNIFELYDDDDANNARRSSHIGL